MISWIGVPGRKFWPPKHTTHNIPNIKAIDSRKKCT